MASSRGSRETVRSHVQSYPQICPPKIGRMSKAEQYLANAKRRGERARSARDPDMKRCYLELEEGWAFLAGQIERTERYGPTRSG
jgi:hypothetical protein